jgi:TfoX/Sxy family transcriptional regulator of competence genes
MFGYPAVFVGGRMFAGLFQDGMVLRLGDADRARFLALPGAIPFVAMGRQMKEWVVVPPTVLRSPRALASWLGKALARTRALPPKAARPRH